MRFALWMSVGLILLVLVTMTWPADRGQIREQIQQQRIILGQSPRDVRAAIGEPTKVTKIQTEWDTTEAWVYGEGTQAIAFTFVAGKLARITDGAGSAPK
jgi:hypothetical protein